MHTLSLLGAGTRMGGGKGQIDQYVTPVKAGRIIIEMAGRVEYEEVSFYDSYKIYIDYFVGLV